MSTPSTIIFAFFTILFSTHLNANFRMIIASDPQPHRVFGLDNMDPTPLGCSQIYCKHINKSMIHETTKKMVTEDNVWGVIINGDLSESGTMDEFDSYQNFVAAPIKAHNKQYFPGLGNHDIEKPLKHGHIDRAKAWDKHIRQTIQSNSSWSGVEWVASNELSYAFQKEGYLFIQLNVSPFYSKSTDNFTIKSPWNFLLEMQTKAAASNLKIVLNFHAYIWDEDKLGWNNTRRTDFDNFLNNSNVVAIFIGHQHQHLGRIFYPKAFKNKHGQYIDIVHSGAIFLGSYLIVDFSSHEIKIQPVVQDNPEFNNYTHAFEDNGTEPFTITFGNDHTSQPPAVSDTQKCYQSYKNPEKLPSGDKGNSKLPYFICDFDKDGHADYIRFVETASGPILSVALWLEDQQRHEDYAFNSNKNIDIGHYGVNGIHNPWLEDVNKDGLLDYVRYVGNRNSNPRRAVLLASAFPRGFDNQNQYLSYTAAKQMAPQSITSPHANRYSLVAYDHQQNYAGRMRIQAGGRGSIPWLGRKRHTAWNSYVRFHYVPGDASGFYIEIIHPTRQTSLGFMGFDASSGVYMYARLTDDISRAKVFRFENVSGKHILTTRLSEHNNSTYVLAFNDEMDKFRYKAKNNIWRDWVSSRGPYLWRVCSKGDMAQDCQTQDIVNINNIRKVNAPQPNPPVMRRAPAPNRPAMPVIR